MTLSTTPTFVRQADDSPISEIALRLVVEFSGGKTHMIGTAMVIGGHLAITAAHNLDDILERFGARSAGEGILEITDYAVRLYQVLPGPRYAIWNVLSAAKNHESDIAILHLGLHSQSVPAGPIQLRSPIVSVVPPVVGSVIAAFGYHSSVITTTLKGDGSYHLDLRDEPTTATGVVEEILPGGQPAGRFTSPCYRVAARFDGGMSGGPVFDEKDVLVGIISGTYGITDGLPLSYVSLLWPMLRIQVTVDRGGAHPKNVRYPAIDLALSGVINVIGLETLDASRFPDRQLPRR